MKKLKYALKWIAFGVIIWSMIVVLIYLLCPCAASAESHTGRLAAIVSFDDAEHLVALTDSVVGVCDTVRGEPTYKYVECHSHKCREVMEKSIAEWGGELAHIDGYCDSPEGCLIGYYIYYSTITCRRLVDVEVTKFAEKMKDVKCIPCPVIPGIAIIFYESYRPVGEVER